MIYNLKEKLLIGGTALYLILVLCLYVVLETFKKKEPRP